MVDSENEKRIEKIKKYNVLDPNKNEETQIME